MEIYVKFILIAATFALSVDRFSAEAADSPTADIVQPVDSSAMMYCPRTPRPPYPYKTEDVNFSNGEVALAGTLCWPASFNGNASDVPVVLMVSGSGQQNRDEELLGHKPFLVIADYLARNGIASLRYDDRGVGASTGDPNSVTIYSNAEDAAAGIAYLRDSCGFSKVGVLGHSEGGTIAFMLAAGGMTDFILSLAGSALRGDVLLVEQNRSVLNQSGVPFAVTDDYCSVLGKVLEYRTAHAEIGETLPDAEAIVDSLVRDCRAELPAAFVYNLTLIASGTGAWLDSFVRCDPAGFLPEVVCPAFVANGSLDVQVPAELNLAAVRTHLPENPQSIIKEYPRLNHLFQRCETGSVDEYAKLPYTISTEVLKDMTRWIKGLE